MNKLTPLEQVPAIDAELRKKLAAFWITSVEELVSTAKANNTAYGNGRAALALELGMTEAALKPLISAANDLLPPDIAASFSVPVDQTYGEGLYLKDYKDLDASAFAVPINLPVEVAPLFTLAPPQNQGVRNSCVAFTLAAAYQILSRDATDLSEQFLYWACKEQDGIHGDVGTNPLKAAQVLQTVGVCREVTWPYQPAPSNHDNPGLGPPPPAAQAEAQQRRIQRFTPLPATSVPAIKAALASGKPVLIGLHIQEHWAGSWQGSTLGRLRTPLRGEQQRGGHAMCLLGYRDDEQAPGHGYFIARNSWGPAWGKANPNGAGFCHIAYKLVSERGLVAIALEGVATAAVTPPAGSGGSQTVLSSGGKLGGSAGVTLADLYTEAQAIRERLNTLVANLGALLNSTAVAPVAEVPPAPTPPLAPADQAVRPKPKVKRPTGGFPFVRLSGGTGSQKEELYPNGLSPEGKPLLTIDAAAASRFARSKHGGETEARTSLHKTKQSSLEDGFGVVSDVDSQKLAEARWAVVLNANEDAALIKALWPLITHRMIQMGLTPPTVSFSEGESAGAWLSRHTNGLNQTLKESWGKIPPVLLYHPDESLAGWLARHNVGVAMVDPRRGVPYYLLLVGRPGPLKPTDETAIPLAFQYELDIFWAVGRLCFTDAVGQHRLNDYTTYAERLVQFEQRSVAEAQSRLRKEVVYFATRHEDDRATIRSADELVRPLIDWTTQADNTAVKTGFTHSSFIKGDATRTTFERVLSGSGSGKAPALLFTASHGLGLPLSDDRLVLQQGALIMGDWSGYGNVLREHWFAGEDLSKLSGGPQVEGTVAFLFACYGAGCPAEDEFVFADGETPPQIAHFPLISQLPQQLLLNGALGVLGHVDRAWTYSFSNDTAKAQTQPFEDVLGRLMRGRHLGDATDQFNVIQSARAQTLVDTLVDIKRNKVVDPLDLAKLWMARNDARNYALLGDPAARLPYY